MIVVVVPVPVIVTPPGVLVNVQVPDDGKLFNTTLPVATEHVGCVMVPAIGAVGIVGCILITTLADATDKHVEALVTV